MAKSFVAKNSLMKAVALICVANLSACSAVGDLFGTNRIDYKSASKVSTTSLDVPPDLTPIRRDSRFAIPENNQSSATASSYNLQKNGKAGVTATSSNNQLVAPISIKDMKIERDGSQRWLVVKQTPEALWPQLKEFWQELGFLISIDSQETGVMETDWAENRAKIPQDAIRSVLGKVLDSLYSTGERDKFRTRLERAKDGSVEIYISHRGAEEVLVGSAKDQTSWTPRPVDPGLEAEFLTRLMVKLGAEPEQAKTEVAKTTQGTPRSKLVTVDNISFLQTDEGFDRSWRRVGLALDRVGFTVEDRDRSQGLYYVRYIDQDIDAKTKGASDGFFSRLFSWGSDPVKSAQKFRINVKEKDGNCLISVHGDDGKVSTSPVADKILKLLNEQLK